MSEITIYKDNQVVATSIVVLLKGKRVKDATDKELDTTITVAIEKANLDTGRSKVDAFENDHMCNTLMNDARRGFSTLTLDELSAYIENGSKGMYSTDPVYKPTVVLVNTWWNAGMQDSRRIEARKQLDNEVYEPPSEIEKQALRIENIKKAWAKFQSDKRFDDIGNAVYDALDKMELIPFNNERKREFMETARQNLLVEYAPEKALTDRGKRQVLKNIIDGILAGEEKNRIKAEAKRIALNTFFSDLMEMDTDIEEILP